MTPTQTKRAIEIMQKHGQDGWKIEHRCNGSRWGYCGEPMFWNWCAVDYRAVGPRKCVQLKRGMEVRTTDGDFLVIASACPDLVVLADMFGVHKKPCNVATHYRCACGESPWIPIEGEPEIISMEGVE